MFLPLSEAAFPPSPDGAGDTTDRLALGGTEPVKSPTGTQATYRPKRGSWRVSAQCLPVGHPDPRLVWSIRSDSYTPLPRFDRPNPSHWPRTADLLIAEYVCGLCCLALYGLTPQQARTVALSESTCIEYVDYAGRRFPAARCGGNGSLIDLSIWPRKVWRR